MRRSDLILYLGILVLFLGLVSWFVSQDRTAEPAEPAEAPPADGIPEIPEPPATAGETAQTGEQEDGLLLQQTLRSDSTAPAKDRCM